MVQLLKNSLATTSDNVMSNTERQEQVRKYAEEALENLLNLNSKDHINVNLKPNDLKFVNVAN